MKKVAILSAFLLFAQVFAQTQVTQEPVERSQLFIYYDFDSTHVVNKTVIDVSANGHNGTIMGSPVTETGKFKDALTFHNEVGGDQLVNAGAIDVNGSTFTVMAWVTVLPAYQNMSAYMKIVSKKTTWDETAGFELQYNPADKTITFLSSGTNTGNATNVTLDSNWHHVAAVVTGSTVKIFVDGVDKTTDGDINTPAPNPGKEFLVGSSSLIAPAGGAWVGSIDEFRIYNLALTPGQLMYVMNGADLETQPSPSTAPTAAPTVAPSTSPSVAPSVVPTVAPTVVPTASMAPTTLPTVIIVPVQSPAAESSAAGVAISSFIVCVSVFVCLFMM